MRCQVGSAVFQHTMCGEKLATCWSSFAYHVVHVNQVSRGSLQMVLKIWTALYHKHDILTDHQSCYCLGASLSCLYISRGDVHGDSHTSGHSRTPAISTKVMIAAVSDCNH